MNNKLTTGPSCQTIFILSPKVYKMQLVEKHASVPQTEHKILL